MKRRCVVVARVQADVEGDDTVYRQIAEAFTAMAVEETKGRGPTDVKLGWENSKTKVSVSSTCANYWTDTQPLGGWHARLQWALERLPQQLRLARFSMTAWLPRR